MPTERGLENGPHIMYDDEQAGREGVERGYLVPHNAH